MPSALADLEPAAAWIDALAHDRPVRDDDAALAQALVCRGGAIGSRARTRPLVRTRKTSVPDSVTQADHEAERDIVAALRALRPDDAIVGEEGSARAGRSGRTWIIDPIDGTYNYASGIGRWCSAIALRYADGRLVGAVRAQESDETWVGRAAAHGPGELWLNGKRLPALRDAPLAEVAICTYLHPTRMTEPDAVEPWLAAAAGSATVRMLGSGSLDLAAVATGRAGGFLHSDTADWDWFPGLALVRAAGGVGEILHHRGHRWHLAGPAQVVADLGARLLSS